MEYETGAAYWAEPTVSGDEEPHGAFQSEFISKTLAVHLGSIRGTKRTDGTDELPEAAVALAAMASNVHSLCGRLVLSSILQISSWRKITIARPPNGCKVLLPLQMFQKQSSLPELNSSKPRN
ncbi:hypothetical protein QCA50_007122 [Cerrena zonata]|uniref:Uncharacterized protein n=1 Tax=Cerrena zonata TaxID=2478898 RepID=A0AAW0G7M7_9APHY